MNQSLKNKIERLTTLLQNAPKSTELAQLCTRSEELEMHNKTLIREIEKASRDKEDLKQCIIITVAGSNPH